jgi:hypothetical protein
LIIDDDDDDDDDGDGDPRWNTVTCREMSGLCTVAVCSSEPPTLAIEKHGEKHQLASFLFV